MTLIRKTGFKTQFHLMIPASCQCRPWEATVMPQLGSYPAPGRAGLSSQLLALTVTPFCPLWAFREWTINRMSVSLSLSPPPLLFLPVSIYICVSTYIYTHMSFGHYHIKSLCSSSYTISYLTTLHKIEIVGGTEEKGADSTCGSAYRRKNSRKGMYKWSQRSNSSKLCTAMRMCFRYCGHLGSNAGYEDQWEEEKVDSTVV